MSHFKDLEGLDSVRRRPGMYIGSTRSEGLAAMLYEVVANGIDQILVGAATQLSIDIGEDGWVTIEDDGAGISIEKGADGRSKLEIAFTTLHSGPTLDGHHPHVHVRHMQQGIGVGPVSALSSRLEVETRREGVAYRAAFEQGRVAGPITTLGPTPLRGTLIRYQPDPQLFEEGARHDLDAIELRLHELARLCPKLELRFQGRPLHFPDGLSGWVRDLAPEIVKETLLSAARTVNDVDVEVAFAWRPRASGPLVRSFVNYAPTLEAGSHERGLITAIEQVISQKRASRKKKALSGLVAIVHVGLLHPKFRGPIRAHLEVEAARVAVRDVVTQAINEAPWWWDRLNTAIG